jgi:hypothetical protein
VAITRFRVKEAFSATLLPTRRRERFVPGELIVLVDGSVSPSESQFIRVNGIRRSQGAECRYAVGSDELKEKTEIAGTATVAMRPRLHHAGRDEDSPGKVDTGS